MGEATPKRMRGNRARATRVNAGSPVRFGTSGWRDVLGEGFTFARARAVVQATAEWVLAAQRAPRVVVAHDTRFLGARFAREAAAILAQAGVRAWLGAEPVPTPVAAHAVTRRRAAAGIVFTASHNAAEYQGVKILTAEGASAPPEQTRGIERRARTLVGLAPAQDRSVPRARADFLTPYRRELLALLDQRALARSGLRVAYDALHGAGAGVLDRVLREAGVSVRTRRTEPDPRFGNVAPDPHPEQLGMLCQEVRLMPGLRLGLATDGDADRYAVVDADGRALCETHVIALLVDYLARTNRVQRGVAISLATGSLVEHVAREHGLRVERHPIGFKHLASALREGRADCAGEESGGFALASFGLDKDGILAGCLLAELVATTGAPLRRRLGELFRRFGPSECGRLAVSADARAREALRAVASAPPERVAGAPVRGVLRRDGLRMRFDDGFVMLRASGTEPVLRIYAEAPGRRALERRLRAGARLLLGGRAGRAATRRP